MKNSSDLPCLPSELTTALDQNQAARETFIKLPPSHQREYIDWIREGKKVATRRGRAEKTVRMLLERQKGPS